MTQASINTYNASPLIDPAFTASSNTSSASSTSNTTTPTGTNASNAATSPFVTPANYVMPNGQSLYNSPSTTSNTTTIIYT